MEELHEYTLEHKEDIWKVPKEIRILTVNCRLNLHLAKKIIENCRELEFAKFSPHAFEITNEEAIEYLEDLVFVQIVGKELKYDIDKKTRKKIKELWDLGDHSTEHLSKKFNISKDAVYHIVHEKAPEHAKEEKHKHGR
ncbi:MAG: hypothetical protein R6U26_01540 [Candidatus Undinarchaeales archaeon]